MRRFTILACLLPVLAVGGCLSSGGSASTEAPITVGAGVREDTRMTQVMLDQLCLAFGERYLIAIGNGCNQVERLSKDPEGRTKSHSFKLQAASSIYDILSGPNPFAKLMDLILLAELQHRVWVTDGVAVKVFHAEAAAPLAAALQQGRDDVWSVADQILKPEQRKAMAEMIDDWRAKSPSAESVAFVRFSDFAAFRGKSILDGVPHGSGLLAPVAEATRQLEETRMLAERGMFLAKRMPLLARWHAESFLNTALLNPEIRKLSDSVTRAVAVAESLPAKVTEERTVILKTMEDQERAIGVIAKDVRVTVADVKEIVKETHTLLQESQAVLKAADELVVKLSPAPGTPGVRPFDIREYSETLRESVKAVHEARGLLESGAWSKRVAEVNQAAQHRVSHASDEVRGVVHTVFWYTVALITLTFFLALTYGLVMKRVGRAKAA